MEHCSVTPWSFGQEGEEERKLKTPQGIASNYSGQFIVGELYGNAVKIFDPSSHFIQYFRVFNDYVQTDIFILDLATDEMGDEMKIGSHGRTEGRCFFFCL